MSLDFSVEATDGLARTGRISTPRGVAQTPVFMPVGTRAVVQTLTTDDLEALGAEIVLGNTYHLMLRPGAEVVERFGGLHGFMDWGGLTLTDSGGYQVFSLEPKLTDEGATFKSTYDGSKHLLTPESAVDIQLKLGSDIQMVLDVCPALPAERPQIERAVEQTSAWAERARAAFVAADRTENQFQFGIVQGGLEEDLRVRSARHTVEIGFEGYAVGGLSVGESRAEWCDPLEATTAELPVERPRYFMGLGDPAGLIDAIARGVDMFDCVLPTRLARHGTVLTTEGRFNLKGLRFADSDEPLDPGLPNGPANRYSRGYLRHQIQVNEHGVQRLMTLQNIAYLFHLMDRARAAIREGTFGQLQAEILELWGSTAS